MGPTLGSHDPLQPCAQKSTLLLSYGTHAVSPLVSLFLVLLKLPYYPQGFPSNLSLKKKENYIKIINFHSFTFRSSTKKFVF